MGLKISMKHTNVLIAISTSWTIHFNIPSSGISNAHKEDIWPGRWIAEDCWPSPNVQHQEFVLQNDRGLVLASENQSQSTSNGPITVKTSFLSGSWGGLPLVFSLEELPVEQRLEDALSECWETATLKEPVEVLGFPEVHLQLSCDRPCALVAARLCDVFPSGESSLITRGMLLYTSRDPDSFIG